VEQAVGGAEVSETVWSRRKIEGDEPIKASGAVMREGGRANTIGGEDVF